VGLFYFHGLIVVCYHRYLDEKSRNEVQNLWMYGNVDIIVATRAFGAVQLIIHMDEPY